MTLMSDDNKGKLLDQIIQLEAAIANERVLLAKVKVKRKRLADQAGYQPLLQALEQDIAKQLSKLQSQLSTLTNKPA